MELLVYGEYHLEFLMQQARVGLDVPRLVYDLGRRIELGVDVLHLLDDLRGADQRALLAMEELRDLPRLSVAAELGPLPYGEPVPEIGAGDRDGVIGELHRIAGIEFLRPIDALLRVPLLTLALLVQREQIG